MDYDPDYLLDYNVDYNYTYYDLWSEGRVDKITCMVMTWIVISAGFPLSILAIYSLYSLVRENHVAPVYVINLLISDLIQICCLAVLVAESRSVHFLTSMGVYYVGVLLSVGFMVCIALERFLVVACPLWYRFKRTVKLSVLVSVGVWIFCVMEFLVVLLTNFSLVFISVFLLLPFPVFIFCLVGTLKSLSASISVSAKEKRRIVGTLVLVLLIYTVLFLPWVVCLLRDFFWDLDPTALHLNFLKFSPLADLVLYVFMRKGAADQLLAQLCRCRMTGEGTTTKATEAVGDTAEEDD